MLHHVTIGEGRPVMVLHGGKLDHRHMLDAIEPAFKDADDWQRIYVDLPGHGLSTADGSLQSQDDVLLAVTDFAAERLAGQSFALIGESRGSLIAQGLAFVRPELVDGLLLIVPGGDTNEAKALLPEHKTLVPDDSLRSELAEDELGRFDRLVVQNRTILEKIHHTKVPAVALHDPDLEERVQSYFTFSFDLHGSDAVFDKPCLIVSGRQDAIAGYSDTIDSLSTYPRVTFALLDTAGHSLAWERPQVFKALVMDWLERLSRP